MAGLSEAEKIERGWEWIEKDYDTVTEDATARELAGIAWRANSGVYYGVRESEQHRLLMKVGEMAGRQGNQAISLGLEDDSQAYQSVSDQSFAWAHKDPADQSKISSYNKILGIAESKESPNMFVLAEKVIGYAHALGKPGLDTTKVRELLAELNSVVEAKLDEYDNRAVAEAEVATQLKPMEINDTKSNVIPFPVQPGIDFGYQDNGMKSHYYAL